MPDLQAISLWQPWASLWACGEKRTETRSWALRGALPRLLAVHAAQRFGADGRKSASLPPFAAALSRIGFGSPTALPFGSVVGVVLVTRVYRFTPHTPLPFEPDRSFGDYSAGRWGWEASEFRPLARPVPTRGRQSLWTLPADVSAEVMGQVGDWVARPSQLPLF